MFSGESRSILPILRVDGPGRCHTAFSCLFCCLSQPQWLVYFIVHCRYISASRELFVQRCFTSILSGSVETTARFYEETLDMTRHFDSDWFVILTHAAIDKLELGILQRDHDIVPEPIRGSPSGVMITFVVENCDLVFNKARAQGATIIEPPTDMPYGQRRMLMQDPDGTVVDVSSVIT